MGDRGNIIIKEGNDTVSLYTHWSGSELPEILRAAMIRGESRWQDSAYLARIIFCEMIQDDIHGTTGYGISQRPCDGTDIIVDVDKQTVTDYEGNVISFEEFAKELDEDEEYEDRLGVDDD